MSQGLIGKKLGMTHVYQKDGSSVAVTVIDVKGNQVLQVKKASEKDGYTAVQVGYGEQLERRIKRAKMAAARLRQSSLRQLYCVPTHRRLPGTATLSQPAPGALLPGQQASEYRGLAPARGRWGVAAC